MPTKIQQIELDGFRGARKGLSISLASGASLLVYGENGGGKSTITDAIEWFYFDRVEHLSSQEIGRNGIPALRNRSLADDENATVAIHLTDTKLSATKTLSLSQDRFVSEYSNSTSDFETYVEASSRERMILRYRDLHQFVLFTKAQKLAEISQIIGFGEVAKTRATIKSAANDLRRLEKAKDYDGQISRQQADLIDQLGQNAATDEQFVAAARDLLAPLDLGIEVIDSATLDAAIAQIKRPADDDVIQAEISYGNVLTAVQALRGGLDRADSAYHGYRDKRKALRKDADKLAGLEVESLLAEGVSVLEGAWSQDDCPLCLQAKDREALLEELRQRRLDLSDLRAERDELEEARSTVLTEIGELLTHAESASRESCLAAKGSTDIRDEIESVRAALASAQESVSTSPLLGGAELPEGLSVPDPAELKALAASVKAMKTAIGERRSSDERFAVTERLLLAKRAYSEVVVLRAQQKAVRAQLDSMDRIYQEFVRRERESLSRFLEDISEDINDLFLFMNADNRVKGVRLAPMGDDEEFVGVRLEMDFEGEAVSPPEKYLSESRINGLGLCLFLASVKAFTKVNRFFVLDDVISSFDTDHRVRFGHLLRERFADYQILLLTHERAWFDYMRNLVKGSGWEIKQVAWDNDSGTVIRPAPPQPKEAIENKLATSDTDGAGNAIRSYLEKLLKQACLNLEVKLQFLLNDRNEDRMVGELLAGLIGTLKRGKYKLKDEAVLKRLLGSAFVATKASHDSSFVPTIGDLKAVWADVLELEDLLVCSEPTCSRMVAVSNIDTTTGTISCRCGKLRCEVV